MGFFRRRKDRAAGAEFLQSLETAGRSADAVVDLELDDPAAQELRLAIEARLEEDWQMEAFWASVGYTTANYHDGIDTEEDHSAYTDGLVFGYVMREIEAGQPDGKPVPEDISVRLREPIAEQDVEKVARIVADVAEGRLEEIRSLSGEAVDRFDYWAHLFCVRRSRERNRAMYEAADIGIPAIPSQIDFNAAINCGYALRCCEEVSGNSGGDTSGSV